MTGISGDEGDEFGFLGLVVANGDEVGFPGDVGLTGVATLTEWEDVVWVVGIEVEVAGAAPVWEIKTSSRRKSAPGKSALLTTGALGARLVPAQ